MAVRCCKSRKLNYTLFNVLGGGAQKSVMEKELMAGKNSGRESFDLSGECTR